ncbi:carboxypeptidase M32 [uncultured Maritalea sp.]|uniref:carboxypeptidase M32 n=1 Tax=uncultured Maritalea sp. TaxID=757249 RepID=UPI002636CE47|nr:carboxypeptidase M32 [uncultured Maritalea sp.]
MSAYRQLVDRFNQISAIRGASAMLGWDAETMMPDGAAGVRGEQLAALAGVAHEKITDAGLSDLLEAAKAEPLEGWEAANLREMDRSYRHANALPNDLVAALTKATSHCTHVWQAARPKNDFESFAKAFEPVLKLVREASVAKSEALGLDPYDAMLDEYDPGMSAAQVDQYFGELQAFLPDFLNEALDHQATHRQFKPLEGKTSTEAQEKLGRTFMTALGFDFNHGRIDVSAHPFCGGVPGDVRLTTRYNDDAFSQSLYGVLHETGHAMYELGLPEQWCGQPVGQARGMSMHESQSLFLDMQLCRTDEFLRYALPVVRDTFGVGGDTWEAENFKRSLLKVERGLIRVDADEVTYPLHVMLRYRLEKALLSGDLQINDMEAAWNDEMKKSIGVVPDGVGNGCMQDIHWPSGAIGYFPTYTIGAMIAAQLFDTLKAQVPTWADDVQKGDFGSVFKWLRENVHHKASLHSTPELITQATGKPLDVGIFKAHLRERYLGA